MPKAAQSQSNAAAINKLIADTYEAIDTLNASRREAIAEHNERTRKLRDLAVSLHAARANVAAELFDVASVLSPAVTRLLYDPTHSL